MCGALFTFYWHLKLATQNDYFEKTRAFIGACAVLSSIGIFNFIFGFYIPNKSRILLQQEKKERKEREEMGQMVSEKKNIDA
jgi:hypothetical protein